MDHMSQHSYGSRSWVVSAVMPPDRMISRAVTLNGETSIQSLLSVP